ncbi:hypothetical protein HK100_008849 [Physocladia obscura]|uniref:Uncharacterized protein n=1 Tax=Physocladia obscura TaxID=109957 RepID=A0AAD5SP43_9FUNG|nr:hypothetical protein HK100_008849 [Physocladia obscura]
MAAFFGTGGMSMRLAGFRADDDESETSGNSEQKLEATPQLSCAPVVDTPLSAAIAVAPSGTAASAKYIKTPAPTPTAPSAQPNTGATSAARPVAAAAAAKPVHLLPASDGAASEDRFDDDDDGDLVRDADADADDNGEFYALAGITTGASFALSGKLGGLSRTRSNNAGAGSSADPHNEDPDFIGALIRAGSGIRIDERVTVEALMAGLAAEEDWSPEEVASDLKVIKRYRIKTVRNLRGLSEQAWAEMKDLLPITKDVLRKSVGWNPSA